jgi:hypothetical protein
MNASVVAAYRIPSLDHSGQRCLARPRLHLHLSPPRPRVSHRRSLSVVADALGVLALDGVRRPAEMGKYGPPLLGVAACSHPAFQASPRRVSQITFVQFAPVAASRDQGGHAGRTMYPTTLATRRTPRGRARDILGARSCVHATLAPSTSSVRWISRPREQMRCTTIHLPAGPPPASVPFPSTLGRPRSRAHRRDRASRGIACSSFPADHRNGLSAQPWDRRCSLDWPWRPWPGPGEIYSWQPHFTPSALRRTVPRSRRATEVGPVRSS